MPMPVSVTAMLDNRVRIVIDADFDPALMRELQRVAEQVDDDLLHLLAIADHRRRLRRQP